jgi:hypothetical protein
MPASLSRTLLALLLSVSASADDPATTVLSRARELEVSAPGPWGTLEFYQIPLSIPRSYLPLLRTPSQQTEWNVPVDTVEDLRRLFLEGGLSETEVEGALAGSKVLANRGSARVFPSEDALFGMAPMTRQRLYALLAREEGNPFHARPLYLNTSNLSLWFEGSGIPVSVIEDVAKLAYPTPSGRGFYFADLPVTLRNAHSTASERAILQSMARQPGLVVRLRLSPDSPLASIRDYWAADFRNKAVRPLLQSAIDSIGTGNIDIAHLLPSTPRQYLNRFPAPVDGAGGRFPDWFWTCYNFFRFHPRDVYADSPERDAILIREFERSAPPLQFGDMLLLFSGSRIVHGCIHIADDIVYTKNGPDLFSPWVLMKLDDVIAYHDLSGGLTINVYRRRERES